MENIDVRRNLLEEGMLKDPDLKYRLIHTGPNGETVLPPSMSRVTARERKRYRDVRAAKGVRADFVYLDDERDMLIRFKRQAEEYGLNGLYYSNTKIFFEDCLAFPEVFENIKVFVLDYIFEDEKGINGCIVAGRLRNNHDFKSPIAMSSSLGTRREEFSEEAGVTVDVIPKSAVKRLVEKFFPHLADCTG